LTLKVLDLPGPVEFAHLVIENVEEGGCLVFDINPICQGLKEELQRLIEGFEAGYSVKNHKTVDADLEYILPAAFNCDKKPIGSIAADDALSDKIAIIEFSSALQETQKDKLAKDLNRFWYKRNKYGPILIILFPFDVINRLDEKVLTVSWSEHGFKRIDKMIWALKNLGPYSGILGDFAEALAVDIGEQDLKVIAKIAAADRDSLEHPLAFLEKILPQIPRTEIEKSIWRAQVRSFLP